MYGWLEPNSKEAALNNLPNSTGAPTMTKKPKPFLSTGKYRTDDEHFAGVRKVDATRDELFRAMFKATDGDRAEKLAGEKAEKT